MQWVIALALAAAALVIIVILLMRRRAPRASPAASPSAPRTSPSPRASRSLPAGAVAEDGDDLTRLGRLPELSPDDEGDIVEVEQPELDVDEESNDHTGPRALILLTAIARTDAGLVRKENEDSILALPEENLYAVADGMGGYAGGALGSQIAIDVLERAFREHDFPGLRRITRYRRANELVRAIQLANDAVRKVAADNAQFAEMGTTICAARFSPGKRRVYIAHVGDSRVYRIRDAKLEQLTTDHTLAIEAGVKGHMGAQLSRAVGAHARVRPDVHVADAFPEDHYLLCSDGLTKMLSDEKILRAVVGADNVHEAAKALLSLANEAGGRDNVSVVLIRVDDASIIPGRR